MGNGDTSKFRRVASKITFPFFRFLGFRNFSKKINSSPPNWKTVARPHLGFWRSGFWTERHSVFPWEAETSPELTPRSFSPWSRHSIIDFSKVWLIFWPYIITCFVEFWAFWSSFVFLAKYFISFLSLHGRVPCWPMPRPSHAATIMLSMFQIRYQN